MVLHKITKAILIYKITDKISFSVAYTGHWPPWQLPPPRGRLKLNFNDTLNPFTGTVGIGGIVRDECDIMRIAFLEATTVELVLEAELTALHKGLLICKDQGFEDILFEGGSIAIVSSIHQTKPFAWDLMLTWKVVDSLKSFLLGMSSIVAVNI